MSHRTLVVAALVAAPILPLAMTGRAEAAPTVVAHVAAHPSAHEAHLAAVARRAHKAHLAVLAARRAASTERARVVKAAERYIGRWYVYGVLDCSRLTQHAYAAVGKHLPRTAAAQGHVGRQTTRPRPGDLVVWSAHGVAYHVGVYIGRARAVVARHTGTRVGIQVINWGHPTYRVVLT